jgi:hypothetical protein
MHYIQTADGTEELFNLSADVEEKTNLAGHDTEPVLSQFRNLLSLMLRSPPDQPAAAIEKPSGPTEVADGSRPK